LFGNIQVARLLGIPILVNISWLLTLGFITAILATQLYPDAFPEGSPYRGDKALHWVMGLSSGVVFFASIILHELAHSLVARKQGLPVHNITLFVFGGVSQIGGEARRPLHEFVMAIIGPLTSLVLAGLLALIWWVGGASDERPVPIVLQWLFLMNLVVAIFNMAPGFPMDGGRVLRSLIWGLSGNLFRATRLATIVGRAMGYGLMAMGALAFLGVFGEYISAWSGLWFAVLGLFLESSARQSWLQARAFNLLSNYKAEDVMSANLETAEADDRLNRLLSHDERRFIYFVPSEGGEGVVGVLTEREVERAGSQGRLTASVRDVMLPTNDVPVATLTEDAASLFQRMEAAGVWHMPVVEDGRVVGVVDKEALMRLISRSLFPDSRRRPR
jgi:Zn-dependent protease/predicted transcriptional regulator